MSKPLGSTTMVRDNWPTKLLLDLPQPKGASDDVVFQLEDLQVSVAPYPALKTNSRSSHHDTDKVPGSRRASRRNGATRGRSLRKPFDALQATAFAPALPHMSWRDVLSVREVCRSLRFVVDWSLVALDLNLECPLPLNGTQIIGSAHFNNSAYVLPHFHPSGNRDLQARSVALAANVRVNGHMSPELERLLSHLPGHGALHLDLLMGTVRAPLRLPAVRRLVIGEEQVDAWASLGLGLAVSHTAREVEVRIPLSGNKDDWSVGPLLQPAGLSGLVNTRVRHIVLRARGRVTDFKSAIALLFPSIVRSQIAPGLHVNILLEAEQWWDRGHESEVALVARRLFGIRGDQISIRIDAPGKVYHWVATVTEELRRTESEEDSDNEKDDVWEDCQESNSWLDE